jgi:hypothetical protein
LLVVTMVGGCSGKLDQDVEAYKQGASAGLGAGGSGSGTGAGTGGASGKGGSGSAGGAGSASGSPAVMQPKPMGSADGGGWNDSGVKPATPPTPPRAPSDGGAVAEAGGPSPAPAPDAKPAATPPPSASACPNGLDALTILAQKCGTCHGERTPTKGLDLATAGVTGRLVGVKSTCSGRPFLDPMAANSAASYFIEKLDGAVAGCGGQMPFGAAPLTPGERACLEEWADRAIARGQVGR